MDAIRVAFPQDPVSFLLLLHLSLPFFPKSEQRAASDGPALVPIFSPPSLQFSKPDTVESLARA